MKKAFFITIMSALLICSCQKENEEVYSCNKHLKTCNPFVLWTVTLG